MGRAKSLQMEIYVTFTKRNASPILRQEGEGKKVLSVSAISQLPSAQNSLASHSSKGLIITGTYHILNSIISHLSL